MKVAALLWIPLLAGNASAVVPSRYVVVDPPSTATTRALRTTRGGDIFGSQTSLVIIFAFSHALNGIVGMPAPDATGEKMNMKLKEGTLDYVLYESTSATLLGTAIMSYLASFQDMSPSKIVAFGGLSSAYVHYKNQLKGLFDKLGFAGGFGFVGTTFTVACLYLIFHGGNFDVDNVAKAFALPPVFFGAIGVLSPNWGAKLTGLSTPLSLATRTYYSWFSYVILGWGVLAQALLHGIDVPTAIGCTAAVEAVAMFDSIFVRKFSSNLNVSQKASLVFLMVPALTAMGLLFSDEVLSHYRFV